MKRGTVRYWLSFDLGLRGNYDALYEWLDAHHARECGDSVATFHSAQTREEIAEQLSALLGSTPQARLYLINLKQGGKFILGKRKVAPWMGYSRQTVEAGEEK